MTNPSDCTTASPEADLPPIRADGDGPGWDTGEEYLLRDLVREHSTRLQRFIIKHIGNTTEAEDLAQQAFVEAARSYRSFRGESQLSSWLYGIALNLVRNYLSRAPERRHDFVSDSVLAEHASNALSPDRILEQNQTMALLQESLDELPANMRDILLMVGLDDISYEDAAALLTVPIGTVRSRLSRARTALRDKLAAKGLHLDD
ncbi:RNA polymerase sigma factor [Streptomyces cavourensis]|jgi:RNA polymerase sigma-70 factor (ECF subfamily)|nr:RNA polymerase sigma factor [Streptomyces cavourensis]